MEFKNGATAISKALSCFQTYCWEKKQNRQSKENREEEEEKGDRKTLNITYVKLKKKKNLRFVFDQILISFDT